MDLNSLGESIRSYTESYRKKVVHEFRMKLRRMTDQQIKNGLRNIDPSNERYQYVYEEARRRGLL